MKHLKTILTITVVLGSMMLAQSQEEHKREHEGQEQMKGAHRVTIGLGHTLLAKGKNTDGEMVWLPVPSWSFNYDYWISNKWAIGIHSDVALEKYIVEDEHGQELEREKPWVLAPVGIFKPGKHFSFFAGAGVELAKEENFGLTRIGTEYGVELPKAWEAGVALLWDNKWGHYNSWMVEFSFSKIVHKHRN